MAVTDFKTYVQDLVDGLLANGPLDVLTIDYESGEDGETKSIKAWPSDDGVVLEFGGERLKNTVFITVSRTDVPRINVGLDRVYLVNSEPGDDEPVDYVVREYLQKNDQTYDLRCDR